jgi:hypothetical protein
MAKQANIDGMMFEDLSSQSQADPDDTSQGGMAPPEAQAAPTILNPYPAPLLDMSGEEAQQRYQDFIIWMDQWLVELIAGQQTLLEKWADEELAYRAQVIQPVTTPFEGACTDVIPAIAMAVDPIQARLSGGIFQADPIFVMKPLAKQFVQYVDAVEHWIQYYAKHKVELRQIASSRFFEFVKHGHMVFKTIYDRQTHDIIQYDKNWKPEQKTITKFKGPRTVGIKIDNFLFPPLYEHLQDVPICAERQILTYQDLLTAVAEGKLDKEAVESLKGKEMNLRDILELQRELSSEHMQTALERKFYFEIHEVHCTYDITGKGIPSKLIVTYHKPTRTVLQFRYNWYFHQKYPYTLIPYTTTNESLLGIGVCEMVLPFQNTLTNWHRMATDNAYLANIRMFIARTDAKIETRPRLFSGRVFRVDDPTKDFIPFAAADIYNSTLSERQNIFGMAEKRTGISDYLTGRESPILGSRATATSTVALIQEGTKRVEEVLDNIRYGFAEIAQFWMSLWIQYGLDGVDDVAFGDDDTAQLIKDFFSSVNIENINGAMGIELSATDASNTKTAQQQMQLAIIQVLMGYYEKTVQLGQMAIQAQQQMPQFTALAEEIYEATHAMFKDLLQKYDIRNPEAYLPDLEKFFANINPAGQQAGLGGPQGQPPAAPGPQGVQVLPFRGPQPPAPGSGSAGPGGQPVPPLPMAGTGTGT